MNLASTYNGKIDDSKSDLGTEVASIIRNRPTFELSNFLRSGSGLRINSPMSLAGGIPQDRPIGMHTTGLNQFGFSPQVLVLTSESAASISRLDSGIVPVQCPGLTDFTSTFSGRAVMTTSNGNAPGPFTRDISITVAFTNCRRTVQITNPVPIVTDPFTIQTPGGARQNITTVTKTGGGNGIFEAGIGRLEITPITLHFEHSLSQKLGIFAAPSDLTVNLTTQGAGSKKDAASGEITLVGSGQFSGGFLGGSTGNITVTGSFSPHPRP